MTWSFAIPGIRGVSFKTFFHGERNGMLNNNNSFESKLLHIVLVLYRFQDSLVVVSSSRFKTGMPVYAS